MELTLLDYNMVHYHPSELAAAALCLSQQLLEGLQWVSDALGLSSFYFSFSCCFSFSLCFSLLHSNTTLHIVRTT